MLVFYYNIYIYIYIYMFIYMFRFLVIANGIVASYSLVQALRCVVSMVKGSVLFNKPLAWLIFSGDQVIFEDFI